MPCHTVELFASSCQYVPVCAQSFRSETQGFSQRNDTRSGNSVSTMLFTWFRPFIPKKTKTRNFPLIQANGNVICPSNLNADFWKVQFSCDQASLQIEKAWAWTSESSGNTMYLKDLSDPGPGANGMTPVKTWYCTKLFWGCHIIPTCWFMYPMFMLRDDTMPSLSNVGRAGFFPMLGNVMPEHWNYPISGMPCACVR